jgi:hypothetical protein
MDVPPRRLPRWLVLLAALGVVGTGYEGFKYQSLTPEERNERSARVVLRRLQAAQIECEKREGALWTDDVAGLFVGRTKEGSPRCLIPRDIAAADPNPIRPLGATLVPFDGYYFTALPVPPAGLLGRKGRFAFAAWPASESRPGARVLVQVEGHEVVAEDPDGLWPPDAVLKLQYSKIE